MSAAVVGGGATIGCSASDTSDSGRSQAPSTSLDFATIGPQDVLPPPGSNGLIDEAVYQQRVDEYLALATAKFDPGDTTGIAAHLIRSHRDDRFVWNPSSVTIESLAGVFERIDSWQDTRDFSLMYLHWVLALAQGATDMTTLPTETIAAIEQRLIDNRYRYDDPLPADRTDKLWYWSENHRLITLASEYLAGQRLADATFTITNMTGAEHRDRSKQPILDWIRERGRFGFFEWHSNVYMLKNITPLLMLIELADDSELVAACAVALDLCLFDIASHLHKGCYTAPRGRTYKKDKMTSLDEDVFGTSKFLFDDTDAEYPNRSDAGATYFCAASRYRPPQVLLDIAGSADETVVRERHGLDVDYKQPIVDRPTAPYGFDFDDPANLPLWWSTGGIGMWQLARVSVGQADKFRLWDTELFGQVQALAALNDFDVDKIRAWELKNAAVVNFGFLGEASTYAWRSPTASMATVQNHRPGEMRDQAHAWQAAIDHNAMVFTTHPTTEPAKSTDWGKDSDPGYWTGSASMPRSAQFERTSIHLYEPAWNDKTDPILWSVFQYRDYTHAYFPQDHFDEVRQIGNWVMATKDGGHIALWSWRSPTWRVYDPAVNATNGMRKPFDLVAKGGADNVWICQVGHDGYGDFEAFIDEVTASDPVVNRPDGGFAVQWAAPGSRSLSFDSAARFIVDGDEVELDDYPRHHSPWGTIDHLDPVFSVRSNDHSLRLDFEKLGRSFS